MRRASIHRKTSETEISVEIDLDGTGAYDNRTGVGFFDHMLDQLSRHALIDMTVRADGDLHIDDHHTVEDTGIALGQALAQALGDKRGIRRYGACLLPMDDALVRAALDLSGRPYLVWNLELPTAKIGTKVLLVSTRMTRSPLDMTGSFDLRSPRSLFVSGSGPPRAADQSR